MIDFKLFGGLCFMTDEQTFAIVESLSRLKTQESSKTTFLLPYWTN